MGTSRTLNHGIRSLWPRSKPMNRPSVLTILRALLPIQNPLHLALFLSHQRILPCKNEGIGNADVDEVLDAERTRMGNDSAIDEFVRDGEFGRNVPSEAVSYCSDLLDCLLFSESGTELHGTA